jgi:transglutaminase-like putative cysteine protease
VIKFVNLPERAIIRIYTVSGVLVTVIEHNSLTSSEATWDLRNRDGRLVASGVYFWHVEALNARRVGRMTLITAHRR